jgi:hypothetical protein
MFRLQKPILKITSCINHLKYFHKNYRNANMTGSIKDLTRNRYQISTSMQINTLLYSVLMDPVGLENYTDRHLNWYELRQQEIIKQTPPVFTKNLDTIEQYLTTRYQNSLPFIDNISELNMCINESTIIKYLKFLNLKKNHKDKYLVPTLDIDIVWHSHMLDHRCYVADTKEYLGYVLDHNDDPNNKKVNEEQFLLTSDLWRHTYKENYIFNTNSGEHNNTKDKSANNYTYSTNNTTADFLVPYMIFSASTRSNNSKSSCSMGCSVANIDSSGSSFGGGEGGCAGGCGGGCGGGGCGGGGCS